MVKHTKLYSKLDQLEAELEARLVPHLEKAAVGENDLIFCVSTFNPFKALKAKTDREMEELVDLGAQILSLKSKLGEPSEGSIAERICWYCREWVKLEKERRGSARGLAIQFLEEIRG